MIYINDTIPSLRDPESCELIFDDRIEKIELINGNTVQDYGYVESGNIVALTCIFSLANYRRLTELWQSRTKVSWTDEAGIVHENLRIVFRKVRYLSKFPKYVILTFELWKV